MKRLPLAVVLFASMALCSAAWAQTGALKRADKQYENLVYPKAVRLYEKGLRKNHDLRSMERVADSYEQLSDLRHAEEWLSKVVTMKGTAPINLLRYGAVLKANGKYAEARRWFEAYAQTGENPATSARMIESCDFASEAMKDSTRYQVAPEPVNSPRSEFGPVQYGQGYLVVAERRGAGLRVLNMRNNNSFYDIFYAERQPGSKKAVKLKRLPGKVNRQYHEGPATVTRDQNTLYFTRSSYVKDRRGRSPMQQSKLKIYSAEMKMGKWKNVQPMAFNSENYSCGHPALSPDGQWMVFASDIPGGFGGTDLYVCHKEGTTWSTPENLGSTINTDGEEQFPYIHQGGALFFSSTGHPGFGGFDLYVAPRAGERWGKATNCGFGLNSIKDDFSIMWLAGKSSGYFASNREGNDDIYSFKRMMRVKNTIVNRHTGKPMQGVAVTVAGPGNKEMQFITDAKGEFSYTADWGKEYLVTATKAEHLPLREKMSTGEVGPTEDLNKTFMMEEDLVLTVAGKITDATTKQPVPGVLVRLVDQTELKATTDAQGNYTMRVDPNHEYTIVVRKPGFIPQILNCSTVGKAKTETFAYDVALEPGSAVLVEGRTVINESQAPIGGVNVRTVSMTTQEEYGTAISRNDGRFWNVVLSMNEPTLFAAKPSFFTSRAEIPGIDSTVKDTVVSVTIGMVPYEVGALVKTIYYDYNKSDIKKLATRDLWEIIYFMQDNPGASVELSSYTDSRGGAQYNEELSQRRADAAVNYIVSKKIDRSRIVAKGYGEANLVNKCKDNVECTDEEHSQNRRTEIRITKLN